MRRKDGVAMKKTESSKDKPTNREVDVDEVLDFSSPDLKAELDRRSADHEGEVAWEGLRFEHEK
jgi:hypothetical protein